MCLVGLSESGHGGRFEPCDIYRAVDQHVQELADENAALRKELESSQQDHLDTIIEQDALRQERDRLAGIVEKSDAMVNVAMLFDYNTQNDALRRLVQSAKSYQEARHAG